MSFIAESQQSRGRGFLPRTTGLVRAGALVAGVEVSVLVSESHSLTANASALSLESGAQVSDHVIVAPDEVSIVFSMTNAGNGKDRARDVFETFKRLRDERTLIELITEHHLYSNMVITSLSPLHQAPYKGALNCTLKLQQINFVELKSVGRAPRVLKGTAAKTGSAPVNAGQQEAKPVESPRWNKDNSKEK